MGALLKYSIKNPLLFLCILLCSMGMRSNGQTYDFNPTEQVNTPTLTGDDIFMSGIPCSANTWCADWTFIQLHLPSWRDSFIMKSNHTFVRFYVNNYSSVTTYLTPVNYNYILAYHVDRITSPDPAAPAIVTNYDTLRINYNNSTIPFQDIDIKKYDGCYRLVLTIDAIFSDVGGVVTAAALTDPALRNFTVEASIVTQHYDKREYGDVVGTTEPYVVASPFPAENHLDLNWGFYSGALTPVSYQLEWAYIDDYSVDPATGVESPKPISDLFYDFRHNSTRVWVNGNNYKIPIVYPRGYVVYRVRAVRPDSILFKYPITGKWSIPGGDYGNLGSLPPTSYYQISTPYSGDMLNWQYTASFAEDGKYKNVASFYDGLLKNRQSITRFNSSLDKLIATGNVYDYEGRLSIKTLPSPIPSPSFDFQHNLMLNAVTGLPYKAADFDTGSLRYSLISPLSSTSLANIYYSIHNPDTILKRHQRFVPDAGGYPFVQTIFEAGNDRVAAVGGAGRALQIGDSNYVANSYVGAMQPKINSFFGPNVGWNSFYSMTVSRDPNQQFSMSIKDYHGKQMASALIGLGPSPVTHALDHVYMPNPNYQSVELLSTIPAKDINVAAGTNVANTDYFSEAHSDDSLRYTYQFTPYHICDEQFLSVQGHYSLTVTNETNDIVLTQTATLGSTGLLASGTPFSYTSSQDHFLAEIGAYHVNRKLTYSPWEIDAVLDSFFDVANCFIPETHFIRKSVDDAVFPCPGEGPEVPAVADTDDCTSKRWEMMQQLFPDALYGKYTMAGSYLVGTDNSIYSYIGCDIDTIHLTSAYSDSGDFHCYHPLTIMGGDTSLIISSQGAPYGIVSYRCFCTEVSIADTCSLDSVFNHRVVITAVDLFDSTESIYFPFRGDVAGLVGNFHLSSNWNLGQINGDIYSGGVVVGHISQTSGGGHDSTIITLPLHVNVDTFYADLHANALTASGDSLLFTFSGFLLTGHLDTFMHYMHPYSYDSIYVDTTGAMCHRRYQDTCLLPNFPDTITVYGTLYTGLRTMPTATFNVIYKDAITAGNYMLADALLPLHPQYCELRNCFTDTFKRQLLAMPSWQSAQSMGLLYLDDIIAHDPLKAKMLATGLYPNPGDSLAKFPGSQARLDTFIFAHIYCGCADSIMFRHCYTDMFNYEITHHLLVNNEAKAFYFENIYNTYLINRQRFVQSVLKHGGSCGPCELVRMTLEPSGEIFPEPIAELDSPILMAPGFSAGWFTGGGGMWSSDMFADSIQEVHDSALATYHDIDTTLFAATVDAIVDRLRNCIGSSTTIEPLFRSALVTMYIAGMAPMGNFTQKQIHDALVYSGATISDLCNPHTFDFAEFGAQPLDNDCLSPTFYSSLSVFLGHPSVKMALQTSGATVSGYLLDTLYSLAELRMSQALGHIEAIKIVSNYDPAARLYTLDITDTAGGPANVKILLHAPDYGSLFDSLASSSVPYNVTASCMSTKPLLAMGKGLVNKYHFITTVTPSTGGYFNLVGVMDEIPTMAIPDEGAPRCIPCTQMRGLYRQFNDTMLAYGIKGADHPLYRSMLANFMNNRLLQQYTSSDYEMFIESCALADSMTMPLYGASYGTFKFSGDAGMNALIAALNGVDAEYSFDNAYRDSIFTGGAPEITVSVDLSTVPSSKLWRYKEVMTTFTSADMTSAHINETIETVYPGTVGHIYVDPAYPFSPGVIGLSAGVSFSIGYQKFIWENGAFVERTFYDVLQSGATPYNISRSVYEITAYLFNNGVPGVVFMPGYKTTIDGDYFKPEKQAYLQYVYSFQALPDYEVLNNIQSQNLIASIPSYSAYNAAYSKETNSGLFKHLYLWNAGMNTRYFDTLQRILNLAAPAGDGAIFYDTNSVLVSIPSAGKLNAYVCSDKTYWYRYFTTADTLFNVYLAFPAYIPVSARSSYGVAGPVIPMPGDSISRHFAVNVTLPGSGDTIMLYGLSSFVIGGSIMLDNVLLRKSQKGANSADTFDNCERDVLASAINAGATNYRNYMDSLKSTISYDFRKYVVSSASESLVLKYTSNTEGVTLYNYDRAGNLTSTVPPAGVDILPAAVLDAVDTARKYNTPATCPTPVNSKKNTYAYTSYNQVIEQKTINGGTTRFMYDAAGRLVFSQNAKQAENGAYTYNIYDEQGRICQTGELVTACHFGPYTTGSLAEAPPCSSADSVGPSLWYVYPDPPWIFHADHTPYGEIVDHILSYNRQDVVMTVYDTVVNPLDTIAGFDAQENLRKRVSCVKYFVKLDTTDTAFIHYDYATHYSYDIQGNVQTLTHDYPRLTDMKRRYIRIDYDYDVISGKVNMLSYNRGATEQFYQQYFYDADNRLEKVKTSNDGFIWKTDARYTYYDHGPLARAEIGDMPVQGLDYAYTIQGWLKALNTDTLNTAIDMGEDGSLTSIIAADAVAHTIDYFDGDYSAITGRQLQHTPAPVRSLYNGNIARQTMAIDTFIRLNKQYVYDQLNRIIKADYSVIDPATGALTGIADFHNRYTYDWDGNIQSLLRYGNSTSSSPATVMDSLTYDYPSIHDDKLVDVYDAAANAYTNDIAYNVAPTLGGRYTYDPIGNLTKDLMNGHTAIGWNLYNKVVGVTTPNFSGMTFEYDGAGNRVAKHLITDDQMTRTTKDEYYVHDAQGNILATYRGNTIKSTAAATNYWDFALASHDIYGSSRLGQKGYYGLELGESIDSASYVFDTLRMQRGLPWYSLEFQDPIRPDSVHIYGSTFTGMYYAKHVTGLRQYEVTDHLGNVLATLSDKRLGRTFTAVGGGAPTIGATADITSWKPIAISAHDYYPFGQYMPGRYTSDTNTHCITTTVTGFGPVVDTTFLATVSSDFTAFGSASITISTGGGPFHIASSATASGATMVLPAISTYATHLDVDIASVTSNHNFSVIDNVTGLTLGTVTVSTGATSPVSIPLTPVPHSDDVTLRIEFTDLGAPSGDVGFLGIYIPHDTIAPYNLVSTICNADGYNYGYNGQMKDNEWAGLGNHNSALYWEYDTRTGRRWNLDPVLDPSQSSYSTFDNTPGSQNDPDGDCTDCPKEAKTLNDAAQNDKLSDGNKWQDQNGNWYVHDAMAGAARRMETSDLPPMLSRTSVPSHSASNPESKQSLHNINELIINFTPILGEVNILSHILGGKGLQDWGTGNAADPLNTRLNYVASILTPRGMRNPKVAASVNLGNQLHYDQLNGGTGQGLPTQLSNLYPNTEFSFLPRGAKGADVEFISGPHPSTYPHSTWLPGNNFGDFKPFTPSSTYNFNSKIKNGKLPVNTQLLPYFPLSGKLK
jgi:YD repeat-containing protein